MTLGEYTVRSAIEIAQSVDGVYAFVAATSRGDRNTSASFSDGVISRGFVESGGAGRCVSTICPLSPWKPDVTCWDGLGPRGSKHPGRAPDPVTGDDWA